MSAARWLAAAALAGVAAVAPGRAEAFCGFYVEGSGASLYNDATQVVLMREGTRTVLSMQNHYQGPVADFAMVVPVPVVLQEGDVKTLPPDVFDRVDQMGAPRLVEYWEQDPCAPGWDGEDEAGGTGVAMALEEGKMGKADGYGVKIEAQFTVGEYQIVILSASDSTGLEAWLVDQKYKIPAGAAALLRPYIDAGSKFFVAKVDPRKVKFENGQAALSPLRFHYDVDELTLPIRLGLANSSGKQDLIVTVLSPEGRYQLANYPNVTIPTNLDVRPEVRDRFAEFYAALFDRTIEKHPGAIVTEYAWDASSCDPCPGPTLGPADFATLGADVLPGGSDRGWGGGFVLTRLHARYGATDAKDDLVFAKAEPIVGGREIPGKGGKLEEGAQPSGMNNFQARYAIRHEWTGAVECKAPVRGRWGGPPASEPARPVKAGQDLAFAPRGPDAAVQLASFVAADVPELEVKAAAGPPPAAAGAGTAATPRPRVDPPAGAGTPPPEKKGCGCGAAGGRGVAEGALLVALIAWPLGRRRRRGASSSIERTVR